jgi:hypothetical protein
MKTFFTVDWNHSTEKHTSFRGMHLMQSVVLMDDVKKSRGRFTGDAESRNMETMGNQKIWNSNFVTPGTSSIHHSLSSSFIHHQSHVTKSSARSNGFAEPLWNCSRAC